MASPRNFTRDIDGWRRGKFLFFSFTSEMWVETRQWTVHRARRPGAYLLSANCRRQNSSIDLKLKLGYDMVEERHDLCHIPAAVGHFPVSNKQL